VSLAVRNTYPSDARLLERERPLDVLDDRACRAVAGLGRWCSSPGSEPGAPMTDLLRGSAARRRRRWAVLEATSWLWWGASIARNGRPSPPACRRRRRR